MSRTIAEIKKEMTDAFIATDTIKALYELDPEKGFEEQFSKVSLESILFYVVAGCAWTLEKLFDRHAQEVADLIRELKPHRRQWYQNKALKFQFGNSLVTDTDTYDNSGLTDEQIAEQQIVKYAAVVETGGEVCIKVATGEASKRQQLTLEQQKALSAYFTEIKDAGVKIVIINERADLFDIDIDIYYDPQVFDDKLNRLDGSGQTVHNTISSFVENLSFNGEYRNSELINTLTALPGVTLVELKRAAAAGETINAKYTPASGYFRLNKETVKINAIPYETISN